MRRFILGFIVVLTFCCLWRISAPLSAEPPPEATVESVVERLAQTIEGLRSLQVFGTITAEQRVGTDMRAAHLFFELTVERRGRFYFRIYRGEVAYVAVWDGKVGWVSAAQKGQYQKHDNLTGPEAFIQVVGDALKMKSFPLTYARFLVADDPKASITTGVARMELAGDGSAADYKVTLHRQRGDIVTLTVSREDFLLRGLRADLAPLLRQQFAEKGGVAPTDFSATVTVDVKIAERDEVIDESIFTFTPSPNAELVEEFGRQPSSP